MSPFKTPILCSLLGALLTTSAVAASPERPIEAFVSPGHLFPVEGTTFLRRGTKPTPEKYKALPVYYQPGGASIGEVVLVNPQCASPTPAAECAAGLDWKLKLKSGKSVALDTAEYNYETRALVTYRKSITTADGKVWSPVDYAGGMFWVSTRKTEVFPYEDVVSEIDDFDQWCTAPTSP